MKILKQHQSNDNKNKFIRIEYGIIEAEKMKMFSTEAREIITANITEDELKCFSNPKFTKNRFYVVRGKIGETEECQSCFYDIDDEDWNYCPNCGSDLDEVEEINNVYRSIEKASKDEHFIELGINDIYVVIVEEEEVKNENN